MNYCTCLFTFVCSTVIANIFMDYCKWHLVYALLLLPLFVCTVVQYEKARESKVGDWSYRNIFSSIKKSLHGGSCNHELFRLTFSFFYLGLFRGFNKFCDEGTSRWAILPPSDLLSFIDFLFHHSQIYLFQFNEILSMNVK